MNRSRINRALLILTLFAILCLPSVARVCEAPAWAWVPLQCDPDSTNFQCNNLQNNCHCETPPGGGDQVLAGQCNTSSYTECKDCQCKDSDTSSVCKAVCAL
jgi:hypothetical protein